ncbi:helix-turn-helix domain-containing protein [Streptomyces sp. NPDC046759]|uniref:helix-turn-helix domain-containing protein n=1 Tax=Streptomyces sp. NPDC046759 TaxID=3155019 RepID=UPI003409182F
MVRLHSRPHGVARIVVSALIRGCSRSGPVPVLGRVPVSSVREGRGVVVPGWAQRQFRPLRAAGVPIFIAQTLATWLRLEARIGPTAAALSVSASAVRKRLARSEALLQRSLLRSPSAVHDQWLAQRALDLAEGSA